MFTHHQKNFRNQKQDQFFYGKTKLLSENYIRTKLKNKINFCIGRILVLQILAKKKTI